VSVYFLMHFAAMDELPSKGCMGTLLGGLRVFGWC
jgi:hypothetical protein